MTGGPVEVGSAAIFLTAHGLGILLQGPHHEVDLFQVVAPDVLADELAIKDVHVLRYHDDLTTLVVRPRPIASGMPERGPHRRSGVAAARRAKRKGRRQ